MDELARRRVPPALAEQLERGFAQVSAAARQVSGVGAVLGRRWRVPEVAPLLGWSPDAVRQAGEELVAASLIEATDTETYAFRHESFQRFATRYVAPAARRAYRRRWVDLRLDAGGRPVEVASVLAAVAEPGDAAAVEILVAAARELGQNTPSPAADLYLRALDLDPADSPGHADLAAEAAVVLWAAQRGQDGSAVSDASLRGFKDATAEAQTRLDLATRLADFSGAETIRQCRIALALPGIPADLRARLAALLIGALYTADEYEDVPELQAPARAAAEESDDVDARLTTLESGSIVAYYDGDMEGAVAAQDEADAVRALTQRPAPTNAPYDLWPAVLLASVGRASAGLARATREERDAHRSGRGLGMLRWGAARALVQYDLGRLIEARAEAEGVEELREVVDPDGFAGVLAARVRARTAAHLGTPAEIEQARREVADRLGSGLRWQRGTALLDAAMLAAQTGDEAELAVLARQSMANREPEGLRFLAGADGADELLMARLALRGGQAEVGTETLTTLRLIDQRNPRVPFLRGLALHLAGLVEGDPTKIVQAAEVYYATADRVIIQAVAYEDAGEALLSGRPDEGAALLERALELHRGAGATNDAARVEARLTAAGFTPGPGSGGPDTEMRVAGLAARGLSTQVIAGSVGLPAHAVRALLRRGMRRVEVKSVQELADRLRAERE